MFSIQRYICFLALIGLAACTPGVVISPTATPPPRPTPAQVTPPAANTVFIRYHRTGGIAGVDDTWLFYGDGRVEYSGRGQGHALKLSAGQLDALIAAARSPAVAALKESYVPDNSCCDRFLYEITLTIDGQTKTVSTIDDAPDQPQALTNLLDAIATGLQ